MIILTIRDSGLCHRGFDAQQLLKWLHVAVAKIVDIAEHGNELAHKDLRMVQATFSDKATIRRFLWAGKTLPLIPNSGYNTPRSWVLPGYRSANQRCG